MQAQLTEEAMGKKTKEDLAVVILSMTYSELIAVAAEMAKSGRAQLKTAEDFAAMLHNWAESA